VATIGSDVGGTHWLVRDGVNGLLFEPGNVESLKQALRRLLSDPSLRQRMGEEGYRIAHQELDERAYVRGFLAAVDKATT
jgi:glycosyltransferase involved in cell wall biosynthesis